MKPVIVAAAATVLALSALACGGGHDSPSGPPESGTPGIPATIVVVAGDQQTGVVNQPLPHPIQLAVKDSSGRAVPSHVVLLRQVSPSGGASAVTDSLGIATFSDYRLPTTVGTYDFAGTVSELRDTVRLHETAVATAAQTITVASTPPDSLNLFQRTYGGETIPPFALVVRDTFQNPVPGAKVTLAYRSSGAASDSTLLADSLGVTPLIHWTVPATLGPDTLRVTADGASTQWISNVLSGPPATIHVDYGDSTEVAPGGAYRSIYVTIKDANGLPVPSIAVTWTDESTGAVVCRTWAEYGASSINVNVNGCVWHLGEQPGLHSLLVKAGAATARVTARVMAKPASLHFLSDPAANEYFRRGTSPGDDVVVQMLLPDGTPAAGYVVNHNTYASFDRAATGSAFPISVNNSTTDAQGIARFKWALGQELTTYTLVVSDLVYPDISASTTATVYGSPPFGLVAAGEVQSCGVPQPAAVLSLRAMCWGGNAAFELGDGTSVQRLAPGGTAITEGQYPYSITARGKATCAEFDGVGLGTLPTNLFCWGTNDGGRLGSATNPVTTPRDLGSKLAAPALGTTHACAVHRVGVLVLHDVYGEASDGVVCWGDNRFGQLGDGTTKDHLAPALVAIDPTLTALALAAGDGFSCTTLTDGRVFCWGQNTDGQLGDGTTTDRATPQAAAGAVRFQGGRGKLVAGLAYACAIANDGLTYCWGKNDAGQLGDGTVISHSTPAPIRGGLRFATLAAGSAHTCGVTDDGAAYCWGANENGQLGGGSAGGSVPTPVAVTGGIPFTAIAAGTHHTCAVAKTDNSAYCWGSNSEGQLGDGTTQNRLTPTRVADYRPPLPGSAAASARRR